jgi:hypothetical protein
VVRCIGKALGSVPRTKKEKKRNCPRCRKREGHPCPSTDPRGIPELQVTAFSLAHRSPVLHLPKFTDRAEGNPEEKTSKLTNKTIMEETQLFNSVLCKRTPVMFWFFYQG